MISIEDYLFFLDEELDGMVRIVTALGDELANQRPAVPGSNTPYAALTHCLGVMEYWGGYMVAGRDVVRDRDAEFHATGSVKDLIDRTDQARQQLRTDVSRFEPTARLAAYRIPPSFQAERATLTSRLAARREEPSSTSTRSWHNTAGRWRSRATYFSRLGPDSQENRTQNTNRITGTSQPDRNMVSSPGRRPDQAALRGTPSRQGTGGGATAALQMFPRTPWQQCRRRGNVLAPLVRR